MGTTTRVGIGYVKVEPDFSGFQEAVERAVKRHFGSAGRSAGRDMKAGLGRELGGGGLRAILGPAFDRVGRDAGRRLMKGIDAGAKQAGGDMFGLSKHLGKV